MTGLQQALEVGEPLLILLDFETFDTEGLSAGTYYVSMNWYAEADHQYDDRVLDFGFMVRFVGDFGNSGLSELTEWSLRLSGSDSAFFRAGVEAAARTTLRVRIAAGAHAEEVGRFEVERFRDEADGSLAVEVRSLDGQARQTRVALDRYLGLGEALDGLQSAAVKVPWDPALDVVDELAVGAWIRLDSLPSIEPAYLLRRFVGPVALTFDFGVGLTGHLFTSLATTDATYSIVSDAPVSVGLWQFVEVIWDTTTLRCRRNGVEAAAPVPTSGTAVAGGDIVLNWGSSWSGLLAEFRYATTIPEALDQRTARPLEEDETADYSLVFNFESLHILDTRTVFDVSGSGLNGTASEMAAGLADFTFVPSATGTREMSGVAVPRVLGAASDVEGLRVSRDGLGRRFCESALALRVTARTQPLWLKLQHTLVDANLLYFGLLSVHPSKGVMLSSYRPSQIVRLTALEATVPDALTGTSFVLTVERSTLYEIQFREKNLLIGVAVRSTFLLETTDPGSWQRTLVGDSARGSVRVEDNGVPEENFFLDVHIGQQLELPDPALTGETKVFTVSEPPVYPYSEVILAEPVWDGPKTDTIRILEYFDATADLDTGSIRLVSDIGDVHADVVAECFPSPAGVIAHLLELAGQVPPKMGLFSGLDVDAWGDSSFGYLVSEHQTVGDLVAAAARSMDGVIWPDLATGALRVNELTRPDLVEEVNLPEVISIQRVDEIESFDSLELRYRRRGATSDWDTVLVPWTGTTSRTSAPVIETWHQSSATAESRAQAMLDLRSAGQEVYALEIPLRAYGADLAFRSVRSSGAPQLADRTWRVIGLGLSAPGICKLLLWRTAS